LFDFFYLSVTIIGMKHKFFTLFCIGFFLIEGCFFLEALEIGATGGVDSFTFHPDRKTAHKKSKNYKAFQEYPYGIGEFYIKGDFSEKLGFIINGKRDNILRNSIGAELSLNTDYFDISVGPLFGIDDTFRGMEMGVIGSVEFSYPGVIFLSIDGAKTFSTNFKFLGKNTREAGEARLGIWLPNVIPYLSASIKIYDRYLNKSLTINDEQIRFQLNVEIFAKNFPLIIRLDGGYEILSRTYKQTKSEITDKLNAIYAGFEIKWQEPKPFKFLIGYETPLYCKPESPMENPDTIFKMFKLYGGLVYTIY